MRDVLTDLEHADPAWLTTTLHNAGALPYGEVIGVRREAVNASSVVAHLTLTYSADAPRSAPTHLLIKLTDPELEQRMPGRNRREIAFYRSVARTLDDLPIVRCYEAVYVAGTPDRFHLLLDDPSTTTHISFPYSAVPPTMPQCEMIVDALAQVHARCWDDRHVAHALAAPDTDARRAGEELHTGCVTDALIGWATETVNAFVEAMGDRLTAERCALYQRIGAELPPRLVARHATGQNLTLTQGDVHLGNFLYPRDPARDSARIIDWKRAGVTISANDLAYMMGLYWYPAIRLEREQRLLRHYLERLCISGVTGYGWDDLWADYRLCVLRQFFEAVWGWSVRQNTLIWWNHLERITQAIQQLGCMELL